MGRIWILRAENRKDTLLRHGKNSEKKGKSYLGGRFRGRASLLAQRVKNPPAVWETWIQSLGWKNPLEKGKATHSSILAWKIPRTVHGVTKSRTQLSDFHFHLRDVLCVRFKLIPSSDRDGFQQQYWAVSSGRTVQMCLSDAGMLGAQQEKS